MDRVVHHIGAQLDAPLDLDRLAEIACFSPYHFHRIYRLVVAETPDQTIRRLRLHRAAVALVREAAPLAQVARQAGYGSLEAFSRAFAAAYGQPPSAFRAARATPGGIYGGEIALRPPHAQETERMSSKSYEITIKTTDGHRLFGLPHRGDYNGIATTFDRVFALAGGQGLLTPQTRSFGIYYDDPGAVPMAELRSFAGVEVGPDAACPAELREARIPACEMACLLHKGPYADLEHAYKYLYAQWLAGSGREPADTPCFEEYLNDPKSVPPSEYLTAVALPLQAATLAAKHA
jgi:AraC family transcriptional regulator